MRKQQGFTIVELLIVIVIIGILASITAVLYNGIQGRARIAVLQSDLESAGKTLEAYRFGTSESEKYPNDLTAANLKGSEDTHFVYQVNNTTTSPVYCLSASNGVSTYRITNSITNPTVGSCSGVTANGTTCPSNFLVVPGNSLFGTSDFCVMKYEAKNVSGVATSQASGTPWVLISQVNATSASQSVCSGCHLISEAEWLTIAHNVLSVSANWSGGAVGNGYIYSGHSDNAPSNSLPADSNDTKGYSATGNSSPSNQRRTLTLTNGEVIWDFAGNVWEWTSGAIAAGQQPGVVGDTAHFWRDFNNSSLIKNGLPSNVYPSFGLSVAGSWTSAQGIGQINSQYGDTTPRGMYRSGGWSIGGSGGIFTLDLDGVATGSNLALGFRVSK